MKPGDLVKQSGNLVVFRGKRRRRASKRTGIIVAIHDSWLPEEVRVKNQGWATTIGRSVDVLWDNGHLTTGFAENALEVISESW